MYFFLLRNKLLTKKGDDILTCKPYELKENICKAFTAGYFNHLVKKRSTYAYEKLSSNGERKDVFLHPSSSLFKRQPLPEWIIFHEVIETSKPFMIGAVQTKPQWVREYSPDFYKKIEQNYPLYL